MIGDGPDNGFDGQYVGYELIQPGNIGTTRSKGIELDFRQQLTFLPDFTVVERMIGSCCPQRRKRSFMRHVKAVFIAQ